MGSNRHSKRAIQKRRPNKAKKAVKAAVMTDATALPFDYENKVYRLMKRLTPPCSCLSFDFVPDVFGAVQAETHNICFVAGSQAKPGTPNFLAVFSATEVEDTEFDMDPESPTEERKEPKSAVETVATFEPAVLRVRASPVVPGVIAALVEGSRLCIYDAAAALNTLGNPICAREPRADPLMLEQSLGGMDDSYAVAFCPVATGTDSELLAVGDARGQLHIVRYSATAAEYVAAVGVCSGSIEDLAWIDATHVLAATSAGEIKVLELHPDGSVHTALFIDVEQSPGVPADLTAVAWRQVDAASGWVIAGGNAGVVNLWEVRADGAGGWAAEPRWSTDYPATQNQEVVSIDWMPRPTTLDPTSAETDFLSQFAVCTEPTPEHAGPEAMGAVYIMDHTQTVDEELAEELRNSDEFEDDEIDSALGHPELSFKHEGQLSFKEVHWHARDNGLFAVTGQAGLDFVIPKILEVEDIELGK